MFQQLYTDKAPIPIIELRPNQAFKFQATAVLDSGKTNAIWSGVSRSYFNLIDDNTYRLFIEGNGQINEYVALYRGCILLLEHLEEIKKKAKTEETGEATLIFPNENHTILGFLTDELQNLPHTMAGVSKMSYLEEKMILKVNTKDINGAIDTAMKNCEQIIHTTMQYIKKLGKSYIDK